MFSGAEMEKYYCDLRSIGVDKDTAIQVTLDTYENYREFMLEAYFN